LAHNTQKEVNLCEDLFIIQATWYKKPNHLYLLSVNTGDKNGCSRELKISYRDSGTVFIYYYY